MPNDLSKYEVDDLSQYEVKKKEPSDGSPLNGQENQQVSSLPSESGQVGTSGQPMGDQKGFEMIAGEKGLYYHRRAKYEEQPIEEFGKQIQFGDVGDITGKEIQEGAIPKPKSKQQILQEKITQKTKERLSRGLKPGATPYPTPDEKINNLTTAKSALDEKYKGLISQTQDQKEIEKLLIDYQKELDNEAVKTGLDKVGNRYVVPKEDIDRYNKEQEAAISEVQGEEDIKNRSWLKAANYKLSAGLSNVSADLWSVFGFSKLGKSIEEGAQEYQRKAQEHYGNVDNYIKNGDWVGAAGATALNVVEQIPLLAGIIAGNKAEALTEVSTLLGLGEGEKKYESLKSLDIPQSAKIFNSIGTSLNFIALSRIGGGEIANNVKSLIADVGESEAKNILQKSTQTLLQNSVETIYKATSTALKGYAIGVSSALANNIVDKLTIDPERDITQGINESGLTWALMNKISNVGKDVQSAKQDIQVAIGKVPKNIPFEDFARASEMILEKDNLTKQNEVLDESFQEVNNKRIDDIKNKLNFITQPRVNKEKINLLNNAIKTELQKEYPDVNKIGDYESQLENIEQHFESNPEVVNINKKIDQLQGEKEGLYKEGTEGIELQKQGQREDEINTELASLLRQKQDIKDKFYDETIKGIDDLIDQDIYKKEKQQAADEVNIPKEKLVTSEEEIPGFVPEEEKPIEKPVEPELTDEFTTSLKRAVTDAETKKRFGTEKLDIMKESLQSTDYKKAYDLAKESVNRGEIKPNEVTDRVIKTGTGTMKDEAVLLYERGRLTNEESKLLNEKSQATDEKIKNAKNNELLALYEKIAKNDFAAAKIGREASNIFNLRQAYINSEMSLFNMENRYQKGKGLKDLTPEQKAEVRENYERLKQAELKIKELEESDRKQKELIDTLRNLTAKSKEQKKADRAIKSETRIASSNQRIQKAKNRLKELATLGKSQLSAGIPLNIELERAGEIGKIAAEKVYQGAVKLDELVRNILDEVKDIYPDWKEADIEKYLSKYNIEQQKRTVPEEQKILGQLKRSAGLKSKIAAKDYTVPKKPEYKPNKALEEAKSEYANLKNKWEIDRYKDLMENRPGWEKAIDKIIKWRTGLFLLSGIRTLGKLAHYTAMEVAWSEPKDILTTGIAKVLLPGLTKKSMSEGQISWKGEKLFEKTFLNKQTYKDAISYLTSEPHTHELYGKGRDKGYAAEFNLNFGKLHGAEKYPLWKATFNKYAQKFSEYYAKIGKNISESGIQKLIEAQSAEKANQRIMMNQNILTSSLRALQYKWQRENKFMYYVSKALFPIVTVPTNFTVKTARSWGGLLEFAWRIKGGFEKMSPEDADKALVAFKNGLPGAALGIMALSTGWINMNKDKKLEIGGWEVPTWMQHHPDILVLKLYAEAKELFGKVPKWMKDPEEIETYKKSHNLVSSIESIGLNTIHETPFLDNRTLDLIDSPDKLNKFLANFALSFTPQLSRDIARFKDVEGEPKTPLDYLTLPEKKRKPQTFEEQVKMGFPWLREQVPTLKQQEGKKRTETFEHTHDPYKLLNASTVSQFSDLTHKFNELTDSRGKHKQELDKLKTTEEQKEYLEKNNLIGDYKWLNKKISETQTNESTINKLGHIINYYDDLDKPDQEQLTTHIEKLMKNLLKAYQNNQKFKFDNSDEQLYKKVEKKQKNKGEEKKKLIKKLR